MEHLPVTTIILTKNEDAMIVNCIETLRWCQEVIVVDSQSSDSTVQLAKRAGAVVFTTDKESFADNRNYGLSKVRTPWVFYLDADERITPELKQEIEAEIQKDQVDVFAFKRQNIHYGKWLEHGGWEHDQVTRLFRTEKLKEWTGKIHESPQYTGTTKVLKGSLVHLTHRNMVEGLQKTIHWTGSEAELLFESGHPPVTVTTLLRKTLMEFWRRAFQKKGRKDGMEGWIEAMVQAMNRFIVYERLWELQQKPPLLEKYRSIDHHIIKTWEKLDKQST